MQHQWLKSVIVFSVIAIIFGFSLLSYDVHRIFYRPMVTANAVPVLVRIDKSVSALGFVRQLQSRHFIQSPRLFLLLIRLQGLANKLKAGVYQINQGESAEQFLLRVVAGDVLIETFRIIEGTTQAQVSTNLKSAKYLLYHAHDWQAISAPLSSAEGLLLADTYRYDAGSSSKEVLDLAHRNLVNYLDYSWLHRSPNLPYATPYELLIAASILEKEASNPKERRLIAGVIVNRLRKNMPLQMDPTVIYGLGDRYQGKLIREDLAIDSPYNTYRNRGLPPTPIAMVGKDSIDAAAHPEPTDYLYFVATGDGGHYFSANYDEQKKAVARYRRIN